jgi:hypothetical protein
MVGYMQRLITHNYRYNNVTGRKHTMQTEFYELGESKARGMPYLWVVYEDYAITDGVLRIRGEAKRKYAPIANEKLPNIIAKLTPGNEEDVLEFARTYGHLGYQTMSGEGSSYPWCGGDPLAWIWVHAQTIDLCLRLTYFLQEPTNIYELEAYLSSFTRPIQIARRGQVGEWIRLTDWSAVDWARFMRRTIINANIAEVRRTLDDIDGKDCMAFTFSALVEVAYWHLANAVDGGVVKRCENEKCGAVFIQTDGRQRFCPARFGQKESACAVHQRVKRYRHPEA